VHQFLHQFLHQLLHHSLHETLDFSGVSSFLLHHPAPPRPDRGSLQTCARQSMSDILLEEIERGEGETLSSIARRVPKTRRNRPVSMSCVFRWVLNGTRGPNGERVRLEAVRLAGKWISSPGALRRFILAQTPRLDSEPPPASQTPGMRKRVSDSASRMLEAAGI
jgi:hypothetical protein